MEVEDAVQLEEMEAARDVELAREREGQAIDEDFEFILQEAISRLNAVYIVSTKEHGNESVHWTHAGAEAAREELRKFAAYKSLAIKITKIEVVR